ncbi:hypothetical protein [Deinococcus hopiensis]|uniref:hypothetical protein n=1 Tax=Deinococcus hopiensis TaxID=309885 RepID=UPI000A0673A5|nr:hypothetical protein [Deinococcus hopiensis]
MTVSSHDAAQGDRETMRRLFHGITDPDRARLLQREFDTLSERYGHQGQQVYLNATTPGQNYAGPLQRKDRQHFIVHSTGAWVVGHPRDLPEGSSAGDMVRVTVTPAPTLAQERQMQR